MRAADRLGDPMSSSDDVMDNLGAVSAIEVLPAYIAPTRPPLKSIFGRRILERHMDGRLSRLLHKASPMMAAPYRDGENLRVLLGDGYLLLVVGAFVAGVVALGQAHWMAVPPSSGLVIGLMVVGVLDAFLGMVAAITFALGVVFSGHLLSTALLVGAPGHMGLVYSYTGLFGIFLMWFVAPQLSRKMRPLSLHDVVDTRQRRYVVLGDFLVVPFLQTMILVSMPSLLPSFTGAFKQYLSYFSVSGYGLSFKIIIFAAGAVRVGLDIFVHHRFAPLVHWEFPPRPRWLSATLKVAGYALAAILIWEVMGNCWETVAVAALYLVSENTSLLTRSGHLPRFLSYLVPRNLFKVLLILLFSELATKIYNGVFVDGTSILGWLGISIALVTILFAISDDLSPIDDPGPAKRWSATTSVIGAAVVVVLFLVQNDILAIRYSPYSSPAAVTVLGASESFIADTGNNRVIHIDELGNRSTIGSGLLRPRGVASASLKQGAYIADSGHNRVVLFTPAPHVALPATRHQVAFAMMALEGSTHSVGTGFSNPTALATSPLGELYVADTGNHRVVAISRSGQQRTMKVAVEQPGALFIDAAGALWIADTAASRLIKCENPTKVTAEGCHSFEGRVVHPQGVAVDAAGNIFVAQPSVGSIIEFLPNGDHVVVTHAFTGPAQMGVNSAGNVYVADEGASAIDVVSPIYEATEASTPSRSDAPCVFVAGDGSLYMTKRSSGELFHGRNGHWTLVTRDLIDPVAVIQTAQGRVLVAQRSSGTIVEVNPTTGGTKVFIANATDVSALAADRFGGGFFTQQGSGRLSAFTSTASLTTLSTSLREPVGVTQDAYGYLDVVEGGGSVTRLVIGGSSSSIATGLKKPTSVTSDGLGNVYVVEEGLHRVWKFSPTLGSLIAAPNMPRDAVPVSITADRDGNFIVATRGSGIVRFSLSTTVAGM